MKKLLMFVGMFFCVLVLSAQVYKFVDVYPEFPGGVKVMNKFIVESIKYPVSAIENCIEGKVYVEFIVNVDGSVSNVRVSKGVAPALNSEAIRIVKSFPKWAPGKKDGKVVGVSTTLPISFKLK